MIVVDASAVIAMLFGESGSGALAARLAEDPDRVISVSSFAEAGTVLAGRRRSNSASSNRRSRDLLIGGRDQSCTDRCNAGASGIAGAH